MRLVASNCVIRDLIHQACGVWDYEFDNVVNKLKSWLWLGEIEKIETFINERLHRKRQKKKALKKLHDYFGQYNQFQYQSYRAAGIPIGSGTVESAIRRVINFRIKSAGQFWKPENAERMIFLRSQVLSGRWKWVLSKTIEYQSNIIYSKHCNIKMWPLNPQRFCVTPPNNRIHSIFYLLHQYFQGNFQPVE